jgi:hypothetical protein
MKNVPTSGSELLAAAQRGDADAVRRCLRDGADVNAADLRPVLGCGYTSLHYAADGDSPEFVRLLLEAVDTTFTVVFFQP